MWHELKAPLTFKLDRFQPRKLAFDSFCNQISLTARMHTTNIIALDSTARYIATARARVAGRCV